MTDLMDAALLASYFAACEERKVSIADAQIACARYKQEQPQEVYQLAKEQRQAGKKAAIGAIQEILRKKSLSREEIEIELDRRGIQAAKTTVQTWLAELVKTGVLEITPRRSRRNRTCCFVGYYSYATR